MKFNMEAVILVGGMGTRLQSVIHDIPKPMAPVNGVPFLQYLFEYLYRNRIRKIILATGYKHECIENYFGNSYKNIAIEYSPESEPMGTGGALKKAFGKAVGDTVVILNGDTFFNVNIDALINRHLLLASDLTFCLKSMMNFDRYGVVVTSENRIVGFEEKKYCHYGNINGGVYAAKTDIFSKFELPSKFSFEADFIQKYVNKYEFNFYKSDGYFIDIGIPEDYKNVQIGIEDVLCLST